MIIWVKTEGHFKKVFGGFDEARNCTLYDFYKKPSIAKRILYSQILRAERDIEKIIVNGSKYNFSVTLKTPKYYRRYTKWNVYTYFIKNS